MVDAGQELETGVETSGEDMSKVENDANTTKTHLSDQRVIHLVSMRIYITKPFISLQYIASKGRYVFFETTMLMSSCKNKRDFPKESE